MRPFFDQYRRFLETGTTGVDLRRLEARHAAIVAANSDVFPGARVVDLGSHDGRWSFAALAAGASHVTAVEARPELAAAARANFAHYGIDPGRYDCPAAEAIGFLRAMPAASVDVVLCLGWFNFTMHHMEVISAFRRIGARTVIMDTDVVVADAPVILVTPASTRTPGHAVDYLGGARDRVPGGRPTVSVLEILFDAVGYATRLYPWRERWRGGWDKLADYRDGTRVVMRADLVEPAGGAPAAGLG